MSNQNAFEGRLGTVLKTIRLCKGMTMDQLEKSSGVAKSSICRIEKGDDNITVSTLYQLAKGLGVKMENIMEAAL